MPFRDVVILLPGITGSTLTKDGKVLWGADLGGLMRAVVSGGDTIRQLALTHGDDPNEDEPAADRPVQQREDEDVDEADIR